VGPGAGRRLPRPRDAAERLDAAGLSPRVTATDLGAVRGAALVLGVAFALVLLPVLGAGAVLLAAAVPGLLVLLPDLLVGRLVRRRAEAMLVELPDVIDLLRIALRSGRSVPETLARVGAHHPGAVGGELRRAAAEMRMGVATDRALVGLGRRCPADGAPELVALLLRAHVHGGQAADGLAALAEDLRAQRARAAIDRASRAAPKIQLVVALLLVPAAMLLIAAALLQMRG
jgi:tight adherence protein C